MNLLNLKRIQMRKLKKSLMKQLRNERLANLYLMNLKWLKIRKQKMRRRRKLMVKMWKMRQLNLMNQRLHEIKVSRNINEKVQRVLDKVLSKLKRVDQKLQENTNGHITRYNCSINDMGMNISAYINKRIYTNQVQLTMILISTIQ